MKKHLITVIGPTAIGKTAKSIALAKAFNSEIISADSRQFYKEMHIGTAVPSPAELAAVPHHFIQHLSINQTYSVGDFEKEALREMTRLFQQHSCLFLVGGSGLYLKAVNQGLDKFPEVRSGLRDDLNHRLQHDGLAPLQQQLIRLDPVYAKEIDMQNAHRIIRALEICLSSGQPFSSFLNQGQAKRQFKSLKIGLDAPREIIYQRIEKRVDIMMQTGLLEEAEKLYPFRANNALNTIGYKELFRYLEKEWTLTFAVSEIKKNSRRFAKRQLTWFRKDTAIKWFPYDCSTAEIEDYLSKTIQ